MTVKSPTQDDRRDATPHRHTHAYAESRHNTSDTHTSDLDLSGRRAVDASFVDKNNPNEPHTAYLPSHAPVYACNRSHVSRADTSRSSSRCSWHPLNNSLEVGHDRLVSRRNRYDHTLPSFRRAARLHLMHPNAHHRRRGASQAHHSTSHRLPGSDGYASLSFDGHPLAAPDHTPSYEDDDNSKTGKCQSYYHCCPCLLPDMGNP